MKEILDDIDRWQAAGKRVAVARVVDIEGSGPRDPGAAMAVSEDGEVAGSVSGGCVEGAVVTEAIDVLTSGSPGRLVTFGYSDDEAFAVGLTCGGTIEVFVEPLALDRGDDLASRFYDRAHAHARAGGRAAIVTRLEGDAGKLLVLDDGNVEGTFGNTFLDDRFVAEARTALAAGASRTLFLEGIRAFVEVVVPPALLLVVGASYSAEDIALQCHKYGAKSVTMCWRSVPMGFKWPKGMDERQLLTKVEGRKVSFKDGSSKEFDAIILCTGYQHHFPFLAGDLKLRTHNRMHPPHLYKGIMWLDNPKLMYLGMQDQFYTFSMFDAQAWYARDVILGRIKLPSKAEMQKDDDAWVKREEALKDAFEKIDFQADHVRDLVKDTDYPKFDIDMTVEEFREWEHDKEHSIVGYRNKAFKSPCTGTMAPVHHTPWLDALDDSMKAFLATKQAAAE